ncbi:MAG: hypothetical protein ACKVUT_08305 [Gaiella sp.]
MPPPRFSDLRRFCEIDGWELLSRVLGGAGDHVRYRKVLRDGTILRTRVSHGRGAIADPGLWRRIWLEQLGLESEDAFWRALERGRPVQRDTDRPVRPEGPSVPAWIVSGLLRAGVSQAEIRILSSDVAERRLRALWSRAAE